jgi:hypothetical protein
VFPTIAVTKPSSKGVLLSPINVAIAKTPEMRSRSMMIYAIIHRGKEFEMSLIVASDHAREPGGLSSMVARPPEK